MSKSIYLRGSETENRTMDGTPRNTIRNSPSNNSTPHESLFDWREKKKKREKEENPYLLGSQTSFPEEPALFHLIHDFS